MFSNRKFLAALLFCGSNLFGATASPVAIAGTAVAGNIVTVTTASAHGLTANQGFCNHTFLTPYCGVVATVPTSTTFTFTQAGAAACAASCGAIVPAKKIVLLDTPQSGTGVDAHYICWNTTQQPVPHPGATSAWTAVASEENAAIAAGIFIESLRSLPVPTGTTLAQAQALMLTDCNQIQSTLAAGVQPGQFYGDYYDAGWLQ